MLFLLRLSLTALLLPITDCALRGDRFVVYMTDNRLEDLALRLGATMVGAVPVTVNWQADTDDRVLYKV